MNQTTKMTGSEAPDMAALSQDKVPLSEMDKAAVLTLIREEVRCSFLYVNLLTIRLLYLNILCLLLPANQIITKEIEVNEWKRKYEESRAEVLEMRYDASPFSPEPCFTFKNIIVQKQKKI